MTGHPPTLIWQPTHPNMAAPKKSCVGDVRGLYTVQFNGQHDAITDVQLNYLSFGAGSKDADKSMDEIIGDEESICRQRCGVGKHRPRTVVS
eukprot:3541023-Prymnesium_polylepis.2